MLTLKDESHKPNQLMMWLKSSLIFLVLLMANISYTQCPTIDNVDFIIQQRQNIIVVIISDDSSLLINSCFTIDEISEVFQKKFQLFHSYNYISERNCGALLFYELNV